MITIIALNTKFEVIYFFFFELFDLRCHIFINDWHKNYNNFLENYI